MEMSNIFIINRLFSSSPKLSLLFSLHCSPSATSFYINSKPTTHSTPLFQRSRGFSQPCNTQTSYDNEDKGTFRAVDFTNAVRSVTLSEMEAALSAVQHDLARWFTGKEHIFVVKKGVKIPLNKIADVSSWDRKYNPHILLVTPYEPHTIEELEKAVVESPFRTSLSLTVDRKQLHAYLSPCAGKQNQDVSKLVTNSCERGKQSIRRVRRKALDTMKNCMPKKKEKEKTGLLIAGVSADDVKMLEKEVEEMTKKYLESIDKICNSKLKEILESRWWW